MPFTFSFTPLLKKKISKLNKKDKVLASAFRKKVREIILQDENTVQTYKNLKAPQNNYKRVHITGEFVLIFEVFLEDQHVIFVDLAHWDNVYKKN